MKVSGEQWKQTRLDSVLHDLDEATFKHFVALQALLKAAGVEYCINTRFVPGLDYYNAHSCR